MKENVDFEIFSSQILEQSKQAALNQPETLPPPPLKINGTLEKYAGVWDQT